MTGFRNQAVSGWRVQGTGSPGCSSDPNAFSPDGTISLTVVEPSPDGTLLGYGVASGGSDWRNFPDPGCGPPARISRTGSGG